jgi:thymidylate synthase
MRIYLDQLQHVLDHGVEKPDRTGVGTISTFGMQARYDLTQGFPAVTTKKLVWKSMLSELLWFVSGSDNIRELKAIYKHNKLWDGNYSDYLKRRGLIENNGEMGRIYGAQWRAWRGVDRTVDQLQEAIDTIRNNPNSRRIIVNAWNAAEVDSDQVALPPCHSFFQFYVADGRLSLQMYQRSCDMFLGVPLNIASYSILLCMIAKITNLVPYEFIHTLADTHIYLNHVDAVRAQLEREPLPLPQLNIADRGQQTIDDFGFDDFELHNYQSHEAIRAKMAV